MARNLQASLPSTDTFRIYDVNAESLERFANETKGLSAGAAVEIGASPRDTAENSVSLSHSLKQPLYFSI